MTSSFIVYMLLSGNINKLEFIFVKAKALVEEQVYMTKIITGEKKNLRYETGKKWNKFF